MPNENSPKPSDQPGHLVPPSEIRPGRPARRRISVNMTVHPDTIERLDELAARFESHRGQVIDRVVWVLHQSYTAGKVHCIDGRACIVNRTDLPAIM